MINTELLAIASWLADEENWQVCPWCRGTGRDEHDYKRRGRCPVCQGRGRSIYDDSADEAHGGILGAAKRAIAKAEEANHEG